MGCPELSQRSQYPDEDFEGLKMIPIAEPVLGEEELNNVIEAVKSGWISSQGRFIPEFEQAFARYCAVEHGIATANGTVARTRRDPPWSLERWLARGVLLDGTAAHRRNR